jgi:hypothetical protein
MTESEVFHSVHIVQILRLLGATSPLSYRGADKPLHRPTSGVFCLMVRIFILILVLLYI